MSDREKMLLDAPEKDDAAEIVARMSHAICGANADNTGVLSI